MDSIFFFESSVANLSPRRQGAGMQFRNTGFRVKPGMTIKTKGILP
jgi:hypothetical protein